MLACVSGTVCVRARVCVFAGVQMWAEQRLRGSRSAVGAHEARLTARRQQKVLSAGPKRENGRARHRDPVGDSSNQCGTSVRPPPRPGLSAKTQRRRPAISTLLRKSTVEVMSESTMCGRGSAGSGLSSGYRQKHLPVCPRRAEKKSSHKTEKTRTDGHAVCGSGAHLSQPSAAGGSWLGLR